MADYTPSKKVSRKDFDDTLEEVAKASVDFDDILEKIAKELFNKSDINTLGKALGFSPADIGRYTAENEKQVGSYMGTLDMLRKWRQGQTTTTERTEMKSALLKGGFVKLADDLLGTPEPKRCPTNEGERKVHIELITDTPVDLNLQEDEAVISCGIRFSTSGVKHSKPFKVTLHHNAVFTDPQRIEIAFYTRGEGMKNFVRITASTEGYPRCIVRNKSLDIYFDHFSDWWIVAKINQYFIGKRVNCTPYVEKPNRPTYSVLLCINDDLPEVNKKVKEEMTMMPEYTARYPPEPMVVAAGIGSVIIRLLEGRSEPFKEMKEEKKKEYFYRIDRRRIPFLVDAPKAGANQQYLTFLLDQTGSRFGYDPDSIKIIFIVSFDGAAGQTSHHSETAVMAVSPRMGSSSSSLEVLATTSNSGREVTNEEITRLSKLLPAEKYSEFFEALGFDYNYAQQFMTRYHLNTTAASKALFQEWKIKTGGYMDVLDAAMIKAEVGGLIPKYKND